MGALRIFGDALVLVWLRTWLQRLPWSAANRCNSLKMKNPARFVGASRVLRKLFVELRTFVLPARMLMVTCGLETKIWSTVKSSTYILQVAHASTRPQLDDDRRGEDCD